MPLTHALPLRVDVDSRLAEDVLPVEPVSVEPGASGRTAVTLDAAGRPLVLVIAPGVGAAEVAGPPESATLVRALPKGADATEIVALVDEDGRVNAFYATPSALLHTVRGEDGAWHEPAALTASTGLSVAKDPLAERYAVTGIGPDGNLRIYTADGGTWTGASVDVGGRLVDGEARLAYTGPDGWVLFAAAADGGGGRALLIWNGAEAKVSAAPETVKVAAPVRRLLATYPHAGSAMVIFTDARNTVYSSVGFDDTPTPIPLGEVVAGAAAVDDNGMVHCYGCAPDGRLWQLRQTAWSADDAPVWAPIFPLDTDATEVRTPVTGFGTLVVTRADGAVDLLSRDRTRWSRVPVRSAAAAAPARLSRYRTRLTVTDANGLPCANTKVELRPASLVALDSAGRTLIARPGQATPLTTDAMGVVEFGQHAAGLDSVTFTARVDGVKEPVDIVPHGYVYDVLAGRAPAFNGTTTIPPMSEEMLYGARVNGEPLAPGVSRELAGVAANAVIALVRTHEGTQPGDTLEVDLRDPDAPRFAVLRTPEAVAARLGELRDAHAAPALSGGLAGWFGDALRAIESGAGRLVHFILHPDRQSAAALVESAEGVFTLVEDLALTGAAAVGSLVQGVMNAIGAAWDRLKDMIQDSLHWKSVWRTMDAFYAGLTKNLSGLSDLLENTAVTATGHFFADLKEKIGAGLDGAAAALGDVTIGELAQGDLRRLPLPGSGRPPGLSAALPGSPAQHDYVWSKLRTHLPGQPSPVVPAMPDGFAGRLAKAVVDSGVLGDAFRTAEDLPKLFRDPSHPGDVRVADLLAVLRDLADLAADALDLLAVTLLEVAAEVIRGLHDMLTTPMSDVPVLTWFWENVVRPTGNEDPMTLGRLLCLALAAPVTLACLLDRGHGPYDPVPRAAAANDQGLTVALFYDSLLLIGVDMMTDGVNLASTQSDTDSGPAILVNALDFVANSIVQDLSGATPALVDKWRAMHGGEMVTTATLLAYWVPIVADGLFTVYDVIELNGGQGPKAPPADGIEVTAFTVNAALDLILGVMLAVAGATGLSLQIQDGDSDIGAKDFFEAIVGPLPWIGQPFLLPEAVDGSEGFLPLVQIEVFDPLGDFDYDGPQGG